MLDQQMFKKLLRKNKNLKLMEWKNWEEELDEKIDFVYFTYYSSHHVHHHIMLIVLYLEYEIQLEFIQQPEETEETSEIITQLNALVVEQLKQNPETKDITIRYEIERERFKKYAEEDAQLQKKMERYIKE